MGKLSDIGCPSQLVQVQVTLSPWTAVTVISGPPERIRTRSPLCNSEAAAGVCIAAYDEAGSEKAGMENGTPSATPSAAAIAIEAGFVSTNILNSLLKSAACDRSLAMPQTCWCADKGEEVGISHL